MTDRASLVNAVRQAAGGRGVSAAVAALAAFDRDQQDRAAQGRELDMAARHVTAALTPVPIHEHHTAATDWLGEMDESPSDYRTAMIAEASAWYSGLDPAVRANGEELGEQARGRSRVLASQYGVYAQEAQREFLQVVGYLNGRQAASGLPQIDQTIDANNQPSPTPYPTEVFETFGPEQNQYNGGVETPNHQSQVNSDQAPMIQQIQQQNGSGSGYGTGPEKPDEHSTGFDQSNSYAEVPLGPPGTIPTGAPGQGPSASSTPNPIAGQPQDAANPGQSGPQDDDDQRKQAHLVSAGYTAPDAHGFRWVVASSPEEGLQPPLHEVCGSVHWTEQSCRRAGAHTASAAVDYLMNRDDFARIASAEAYGTQLGQEALQRAQGSLRDLGNLHNIFTASYQTSRRTAEDSAVLHGYQATVRPVMAAGCTCGPDGCHGAKCAACKNGKCPKAKTAATAAGRAPNFNWAHQGASSLPQIQQVVDPNNAPDPQGDQLNPGVMFPIDPAFAQEWTTGPNGAVPKGGGQEKEAARQNGMPTELAERAGRMHAISGQDPIHAEDSPYSSIAHGRYLKAWNDVRAMQDVSTKNPPMARDVYGKMTGRPDLHGHYMDAVDSYGRTHNQRAFGGSLRTAGDNAEVGVEHCEDCGHAEGKCNCPHTCTYPGDHKTASLRTADTMSMPHQTTDDFAQPFSTPATTPQPPGSDYETGKQEGAADAQAGQRPAFADNSSGVSPYVKGYAEGYSGTPQPFGTTPDVPRSMGGDSGQARNAEEAATAFQVAKASRTAGRHGKPGAPDQKPQACPHCSGTMGNHDKDCEAWVYASLRPVARRVSAAFVTREATATPDFAKGYNFASRWKSGAQLVAQGSAAFEAGLYAGITDNPHAQLEWVRRHRRIAARYPQLGERIAAHEAFTRRFASAKDEAVIKGIYVQGGTSVDLVTDGPGTSPDPTGSTPINGPGTPPPMAGRSDPAKPGGPGPYQGAEPYPQGPAVPDDVMGQPQEQPQPDGPLGQGFSGPGPGYGDGQDLAPGAPNQGAKPGYSNKDAYQGDPRGGDRTAAFRSRVQASLAQMRSTA